MDCFANVDTAHLEIMVAKRKRQMIKIMEFVEKITQAIGKVTKRKIGSCNTHIVRKLTGFAGFDFVSSTGETVMGGKYSLGLQHH